MDELNQISQTLALSMGAAWGSGINLYATLLTLGYLAHTGHIDLPPDLLIVADPLVMTAAGLMYAVEFFADKVPGVDTGWDTIHTFVRIPAGAMLAAGAIGDIGPAAEIAAAIVGGSLAGATHATKTGSRALINRTVHQLDRLYYGRYRRFCRCLGIHPTSDLFYGRFSFIYPLNDLGTTKIMARNKTRIYIFRQAIWPL